MVVPVAAPLTIPVVVPIVAIVVVILLQVPPPPSVRVMVDPTHNAEGPPMAAGNGLTVSARVTKHPVLMV